MKCYLLSFAAILLFAAPAAACDCVGSSGGDLPQFSIRQPEYVRERVVERIVEPTVELFSEPVCEQRRSAPVYVRNFSAGSSGSYGSAGSYGGSGGFNIRERDRFRRRGDFSSYDEAGVIERDRFSFRERDRSFDIGGRDNVGLALALRNDNNLGLALALREERNRDRLAALVALDRDEPRRGARLAFLRRPRVDNSLPGDRRSLFLALR